MHAGILLLVSAIFIAGCVKDSGMKKTRIFTPVYKTSAEVRAAIKSDAAIAITNPGKIFVQGNYIFLNEIGKGIHIIDNTNPSSPVNKAFINIPGNGDLAVKGNILYADCFTDLMAIDISNPSSVSLKSFVPGIFPDRQYILGYQVPQNSIITDWVGRDTVLDLEIQEGQGIWRHGNYYTYITYAYPDMYLAAAYNSTDAAAFKSNNSANGVAGSMSRFALMQNYLYAITTSTLNVVNISNSTSPQWNKTISLNAFAETIYPFKDKLFIGSQTGMFIYAVNNPESPLPLGQFQHIRNCDPVVVDGDYAYVTLHAGAFCGGDLNELDVLDIKDITNPSLTKTYHLTNPQGLSKDGNILVICDGADGLKLFDAKDPLDIKQLSTVSMAETYDVICYNKIAIVSAKDGLYQYDYSNASNPKQLSKLVIQH